MTSATVLKSTSYTGAGTMAAILRHLADAYQCAVEMSAMMMRPSRMTGTR
ncbi:hypothetical protein [Cutibacterium granulosum]|nr:hypothetical protein [Cutibacterium granulosum]MEA5638995.1 hypothetical protein [Cutibacterium granulosum]